MSHDYIHYLSVVLFLMFSVFFFRFALAGQASLPSSPVAPVLADLGGCTAGHPKPDDVVVVPRVDANFAVCDAAVVGVAVPDAAPEHPAHARSRSTRICLAARRVGPIPIPAPLPHITRHFVEPVAIRRKRPNG